MALPRESILPLSESSEDSSDGATDWGSSKSNFYGNRISGDKGIERSERNSLLLETVVENQKRAASLLSQEDFVYGEDDESSENESSDDPQPQVSAETILAHVSAESPELSALLHELKSRSEELYADVLPLLQSVIDSAHDTSSGLSFLELKMHLLLSYCVNLLFYLLMKVEGKSVQGHPVIDELVRLRTYMEKVDPIDQKLRYQIDRLLKAAAANTLQGGVAARPNLDMLESPYLQGDDIGESEDSDGDTAGIYRAPKTTFVNYDEGLMSRDEKKKEKQENRRRKRRRTALRCYRQACEGRLRLGSSQRERGH